MTVEQRFKNMDILVEELSKHGIPFVVRPRIDYDPVVRDKIILSNVVIVKDERGDVVIDAVCHPYSYGWDDKTENGENEPSIEIMAHDHFSDITWDDVIGHLDGKEAFKYFYIAWGRLQGYLQKEESEE